jgi:hypothetical protein
MELRRCAGSQRRRGCHEDYAVFKESSPPGIPDIHYTQRPRLVDVRITTDQHPYRCARSRRRCGLHCLVAVQRTRTIGCIRSLVPNQVQRTSATAGSGRSKSRALWTWRKPLPTSCSDQAFAARARTTQIRARWLYKLPEGYIQRESTLSGDPLGLSATAAATGEPPDSVQMAEYDVRIHHI